MPDQWTRDCSLLSNSNNNNSNTNHHRPNRPNYWYSPPTPHHRMHWVASNTAPVRTHTWCEKSILRSRCRCCSPTRATVAKRDSRGGLCHRWLQLLILHSQHPFRRSSNNNNHLLLAVSIKVFRGSIQRVPWRQMWRKEPCERRRHRHNGGRQTLLCHSSSSSSNSRNINNNGYNKKAV